MTIISDINTLVDKNAIFLLFGCYCNNPKLILDEKYCTNEIDYTENFYKMIWGSLVNIAKKNNVEKITPLEIQNELKQFEKSLSLWTNNKGWEYIQNAIDITEDKLGNVNKYYDDVRKYSILRNAQSELKMDISFLYDENNESKLEKFNSLTSSDVLTELNNKFVSFKNLWKNKFGDNYAFRIGDGINDRLVEHKKQINVYGYPFQSGYLTTIFRGMRFKKFIIRSSISGGCKSRNAMADACNIATDRIYDWKTKQWISTGQKRPALYISTELTKEEIQDCILAHVSGIEQDRIEEWKNITLEEEKVLTESARYVEEATLFCEYMPDFTIDTINETVEKYVTNNHIEYCFFDYINDSPSLYAYYYEKSKTRLRTDQILFMFSNSLKLTCNKYNIYLGSSTQLNNAYKDDGNKDASALKGSTAIIEKADGGILALPVTQKDLKKLKPILESNGVFGRLVPNMSYYIFKNRGGKWKGIIVWTKLNLGTVREMDCFVTDYNYELITDIEQTIMDFSFTDVGDTKMIENAEKITKNVSGVDLANELSNDI